VGHFASLPGSRRSDVLLAAPQRIVKLPTFHNMKVNPINEHIFKLLTADHTTAPDPANLAKCAGKQLQRATAYTILEHQRDCLRKDYSLPLHTRARIAQCAAKGAGRFLTVLPGSVLGKLPREEILLEDHVWRDNVELRLGCGLSRRIHEGTVCGCGVTPARFHSHQQFFDHVLGCAKGTHGTLLDAHELLDPVFRPFFEELGYKWDVSAPSLLFSEALHAVALEQEAPGKKKLDAVAHCLHDSRKTLDIDFSRVHAASESYCVSEMAAVVADSPTFATSIGEDKKAQKYDQLSTSRGHILLPIVLNTYGGFGQKIMQVVDSHFEAKRAEELEKTGQAWTTLGERDLLFQRAGVAVARGNSLVLDSLSHAWSSGLPKKQPHPERARNNAHVIDDFVAQLEGEAIVRAVRGCGF
jgi:hypothetical protein